MNQYQETLDRWREDGGVSAAAGAVRIDGSVVWHGVSHDATGDVTQVSAKSRFPIYSITKSFTAVCVLRLAELGLLDLADPVAVWLDGLSVPRSVRLSHVLRHTGGIPDYGGLPAYGHAVARMPSMPWSDEEFFEATLCNGLLFEPGTAWAYSNVGYLILRRIVERVTDASFRACVDDYVVSPLRLSDTFVAEELSDWDTCVPGYGSDVRLDGAVVDIRSTYHPNWCGPGVAISNVDDVTEFYDALFRGSLLSAGSLKEMVQLVRVPGTFPPAVTPSYGMGLAADPDGLAGSSYGHGGAGPGYCLEAWIVPGSASGRVSAAVFSNGSGVSGIQECQLDLLRMASSSRT